MNKPFYNFEMNFEDPNNKHTFIRFYCKIIQENIGYSYIICDERKFSSVKEYRKHNFRTLQEVQIEASKVVINLINSE